MSKVTFLSLKFENINISDRNFDITLFVQTNEHGQRVHGPLLNYCRRK